MRGKVLTKTEELYSRVRSLIDKLMEREPIDDGEYELGEELYRIEGMIEDLLEYLKKEDINEERITEIEKFLKDVEVQISEAEAMV